MEVKARIGNSPIVHRGYELEKDCLGGDGMVVSRKGYVSVGCGAQKYDSRVSLTKHFNGAKKTDAPMTCTKCKKLYPHLS